MVTVDSIQLEFCCSCLEGPKGWYGAVITREDERPQMLMRRRHRFQFMSQPLCIIALALTDSSDQNLIYQYAEQSRAESIASCLIAFCSSMNVAYLPIQQMNQLQMELHLRQSDPFYNYCIVFSCSLNQLSCSHRILKTIFILIAQVRALISHDATRRQWNRAFSWFSCLYWFIPFIFHKIDLKKQFRQITAVCTS